ncbi:hypothetical protein [Streptomyces sp. S465]|uniref:hypothetical protein n=1 Tax=Streptomyces sp. S465 TaxID=2979468 RepID=UPI0022A84346|nr:hypothetical protein [Streptomyces sp. S465]WAP59099.1 hypothetical protein N6H00_31365 [Streptomyces sp. S465]
MQAFDEFRSAVGGFDDHPFVDDAAESLAFDYLADQPVPDQAGGGFFRPAAADFQFHQLGRAHPGGRGQDDDCGGADDADHLSVLS